MAFYIPPMRHRYHLTPEWLIFALAIFLLLLTMFIVSTVEKMHRSKIAPDSLLAVQTLIDETPPDDIDIAAKSRTINGAVAITPRLSAVVKTTPMEAALMKQLAGPTAQEIQAGQYSEIPTGTQLLGVTVYDRTVTVDLSDEFTQGGGSTSMIGRVEALEKTIHRFDKHYKLRIAVNGKPLQYLGGEGLELE